MAEATRRDVIRTTAAAVAAGYFIAPRAFGAEPSPGEAVTVGIIGTGGRGNELGNAIVNLPGVTIKYVCDVDEARADAASKSFAMKAKEKKPAAQVMTDLRKVFDDKDLTGVVIATPDHWHAPAAIMALAAGKHVYVEKPCCHNPHEGELLVAAQKKSGRCVQQGTQRRTWSKNREAMEKLKSGVIGKVVFARGWYANHRKGIGKGKPAETPKHLNWELWQGPAPETAFHDNYVPYNWHWFWQWGTGECGNNGIHSLDMCRLGLGLDEAPRHVSSGGGKYYVPKDDDWQTPDTQFVTFDYGDKVIQWEGRSCLPRGMESTGSTFGIAFYGDNGTLMLDGNSYTLYDAKQKLVDDQKAKQDNEGHLQNWVDAVRANDPSKLHAPIDQGVKSVMLCHYANISQRTGRALNVDPASGKIMGDEEAMKLWKREYREGWEPKV